MLEKLEKQKENIEHLNAELADMFLKNKVTYSDTEWLEASIEKTMFALQNMKDTIESGKRLNKLSPKKAKQEYTPEYIASKMERGFESDTEVTPEFKEFRKEFELMMKNELAKIGATKYQQINGHFYVCGFFTFKDQIYYFLLDDVRYGTTRMLVRTAKSYSDFTGGTNTWINLHTDMFKDYFGV